MKTIQQRTEEFNKMGREELIRLLQDHDPNGIYTDEACHDNDMTCLTLEQAREIAIETLWDGANCSREMMIPGKEYVISYKGECIARLSSIETFEELESTTYWFRMNYTTRMMQNSLGRFQLGYAPIFFYLNEAVL